MHNPMFDEEGARLVHLKGSLAGESRLLQEGVGASSAKKFPLERSNRQLSMYDPETAKITLISTCFPTHHFGVRGRCEQYIVDQRRAARRAASSAG